MDPNKALALEPQGHSARQAIAEAGRLPFSRSHLVAVVRSLPAVLRRHGLGQTLAFLQMRGGAAKGPGPHEFVAKHLDRWLLSVTGASGRTALAALAAQDSRFYREASEQAWRFLRELRAALEEKA